MSVQKIDYEDKIGLQNDPNVPDKNKVLDEDMNEIKSVVNNNADELTTAQQNIEDLQSGQGTASGDITSLKNRVTALETDNTTNKQDINTLKADNETNKQNIANKVDKVEGKGLSTEDFTAELKTKLEGLNNYDDTEIKEDIAEIQAEQATQNQKIEQLDDNQIHITTEKSSNINVQDASGQNAKINVFGNSIQNGEPTSKAPVNIENVTGDIDITVCNENLALNGYATPITDKSFWHTTSAGFTPLEDGWGKYSLNNATSSTLYVNSFIKFSKFKNKIKANTQYKLLVEIRNASISQTTERGFFCVSGSTIFEAFLTYFQISQFKTAKFEKIITSRANFDDTTMLLRSFLSVSANNNVSLEARISLLEANSTETEIKIDNQEYIFTLAEGQKMYEGDYLADDGIHHVKKQIELNGTENWTFGNKKTKTVNLLLNDFRGYASTGTDSIKALCTHFKGKINGADIDEPCFWFNGVGGFRIRIEIDKLADTSTNEKCIESFKSFLSQQKANGTPVILEYELAEEEIEPYTEEQQEAYNQLQNAKTYKTVTNVFTDNAEVEMEYIADTKTYIDNKVTNMQKQLNTINELLSTANTSAMLLDNLQTDLESEVL